MNLNQSRIKKRIALFLFDTICDVKSSSESSEDETEPKCKIGKVRKYIEATVTLYDAKQFQFHFRMNKDTLNMLVESTSLDIGMLLELIQTYEHLYNLKNKDYKNMPKKEESWQEILNATVDECKRRWEKLRDRFEGKARKTMGVRGIRFDLDLQSQNNVL